MPALAFASSFWETYDVLDKQVKAGVRKAMAKFQQLSIAQLHADKGLHLESVENARDPRMRTIRVTQFWRGVVLAPDDGSDTFLLLSVVPHDEAYGWAAKRLYTVNTATRALEVRNVVAIEQLTPSLEEASAQVPTRLFARHSDTVLRDLGIDDQVLRAARAITDTAQLDAFGGVLPEDQFEVLQFLAEGFSPEEVYRDVVAVRRPVEVPAEAGTEDSLEMAIRNTTSRITLVTGPDELADILDKPFAAWRVFLHPSQRRVAYRPSYSGPAQVSGGPGTGKTVVALHRVKHLLSRSPDSRILLTTFTNALADMLRENLALLLDRDETELARVHVTTVDAFANRVVRDSTGRAQNPITDIDERQRWRRISRRLGLPWGDQFLAQEFRHVILAQNITSERDYLRATRRGRGSALRSTQRRQLWRAVEEFRAELRSEGKTTHLQICAHAADLLGGASGSHHYDHAVVDEAQDLHPVQWRVVRAAVAEGPDDLFITGDPHQRIYDSRVSLRALGIPVAGRSSRLRINYRSTAEILSWSVGVLAHTNVENLGGDGDDTLIGYRSLLRGTRPVIGGYVSEQDEIAALSEHVQAWLRQGVRADEIAVCTRFNVLLDKVRDRLAAEGIPAVKVKDRPGAHVDGVRLASMHAMKGLEFRCVAVVGVTAGAVPFTRDVTPVEVDSVAHAGDLLKERCLLFVACTRARERLVVSWSGESSPFLSAVTGGP
ncbi:UvrD-helicase domain-containing protein [Saccharomonospora azurea]|uniref:UvrD-helicase domain-containing protein n=1 Tax=Saccharomonospora azurea TaxID=40988 RepID=UPI002409FE28|nr:UvrD-helicase domain-containing protein [Saccharomonospora azurea]